MSLLSTGLSILQSDLELTELPVLITALQTFQSNPSTIGKAAAITYLVANAPLAAVQAEGAAVNQLLTAAITALQAQQAKLQASAAPKPA